MRGLFMEKKFKNLFIVLALVTLVSCSSSANQTKPVSTPTPTATPVVAEYEIAESPEITDELREICDKGLETMTASLSYTPMALLATQENSGTNYRVLLATLPVTADGDDEKEEEKFSIATLHVATDGTVELYGFRSSFIATESDGSYWPAFSKPDSPVITDDAVEAFNEANANNAYEKQLIALTGVRYFFSYPEYQCVCLNEDGNYEFLWISKENDVYYFSFIDPFPQLAQ